MDGNGGGKWLGHVLTPPLVDSAIMVLTDMGLSLLSVVANSFIRVSDDLGLCFEIALTPRSEKIAFVQAINNLGFLK